MAQTKLLFSALHAKLAVLGFMNWHEVSERDIYAGCPHVYASFIRFIYMRYPNATAALMQSNTWFILEHDDVAVGVSAMRLLAGETGSPCGLTPLQYAKRMFAARKISLCLNLIYLLRRVSRTLRAEQTTKSRSQRSLSLLSAKRSSSSPEQSQKDRSNSRDEHQCSLHRQRQLLYDRRVLLNSLPRS